MAVESLAKSSSSSNSSGSPSGEVQECPLCMESLDLDDKSFYPCTCGYQICRFCWHRLLSDSNPHNDSTPGACPACRKPYSENPANFKPLSVEDVQLKLKQQRKQKDQAKKKTVDSRKHLGDLRVVQKNLVFVVGITPRIADAELLKKNEYFGRFGRIHKVVVNAVSGGNGERQSHGAYITYTKPEDALRAIQSVNNVPFDGKTIKASLGTTKYCSHFMRNQSCPKSDCMYLHGLGDPEASFTKEDMQMGKHQEYEKRLISEWGKCQESEWGEEEEEEEGSEILENGVSNGHHHIGHNGHLEAEKFEKPESPILTNGINGINSEPHPLLPELPKPIQQIQQLQHPQKPQQQLIQTPVTPPEPEPQLDSTLDFDPFYETQQAFESIIQEEINSRNFSAPPGFNKWNNNPNEEWIDPAIIYSSSSRGHVSHLLGNSLIDDIFSSGGGSDRPPQQYPQQYQQQPQFYQMPKYSQPPPGFQSTQQQQGQFINNNFFNNFPF